LKTLTRFLRHTHSEKHKKSRAHTNKQFVCTCGCGYVWLQSVRLHLIFCEVCQSGHHNHAQHKEYGGPAECVPGSEDEEVRATIKEGRRPPVPSPVGSSAAREEDADMQTEREGQGLDSDNGAKDQQARKDAVLQEIQDFGLALPAMPRKK
jgi:hypothetical protein